MTGAPIPGPGGGLTRAITVREMLSRLAGACTVKTRTVREITRTFSVEELHELVRAVIAQEFDLAGASVAIDVNYVTDFDGFSDDSRDIFNGLTVTVTQELE